VAPDKDLCGHYNNNYSVIIHKNTNSEHYICTGQKIDQVATKQQQLSFVAIQRKRINEIQSMKTWTWLYICIYILQICMHVYKLPWAG